MPNSIDFCKWIFLHVIPVRIIVPWRGVASHQDPHKHLRYLQQFITKLSILDNLGVPGYACGHQTRKSFWVQKNRRQKQKKPEMFYIFYKEPLHIYLQKLFLFVSTLQQGQMPFTEVGYRKKKCFAKDKSGGQIKNLLLYCSMFCAVTISREHLSVWPYLFFDKFDHVLLNYSKI